MSEQKEFYSINEIEKLVKRNRGTVYNRIKLLGIKTYKFEMDRHSYVAADDVKRIQTVLEKPWMVKELKKATTSEESATGSGLGQAR
jgi:hypothetical protein